MKTSTDFAKQITRFLSEHLPYERNVSKNTITSYRDCFVQFIDFMKVVNGVPVEKLTLSDMTRGNVLKYLRWIMDDKGVSASTRNYRLAAIHSFCKYLQYTVVERLSQWQDILSIKAMRTSSGTLNYLSKEGIKLILAQPDTSTRQGRRHLAILSLLYDTGARVQEIADLTVSSVRLDVEPYTIRLFGKGRKTRIVPLAREQVAILRTYMEEYNLLEDNHNISSPLFFNTKREKLTREGIAYILKAYVTMARQSSPDIIPDKISCHCIRHSKAMHLLEAGINLVYIRDILGHTSIQSTNIYARADSKSKREALEKAYENLNPIGQNMERKWENDKDLLNWLKSLS